MLHVHIGLHKTGTSSIQSMLRKSAPLLEANGYLVPAIGPKGGGIHHNLAYQLDGNPLYSPQYGGIDEIAEILRANPRSAVLLSCEYFCILQPDKVEVLRRVAGPHPVQVIAYARAPDTFIRSQYMQLAKHGLWVGDFDTMFAASKAGRGTTSIRNRVQPWTDTFGPGNTRLRPYEKLRGGSSLIDDYIEAIGLPPAVGDHIAKNNRQNVSPGWQAVELCRSLYNNSGGAFQDDRGGSAPRPKQLVPVRKSIVRAANQAAIDVGLPTDPGRYLTEAQIETLAAMHEIDLRWIHSNWPDFDAPQFPAFDTQPREFLPSIEAIEPRVRTAYYRRLAEIAGPSCAQFHFSFEWLRVDAMRIVLDA